MAHHRRSRPCGDEYTQPGRSSALRAREGDGQVAIAGEADGERRGGDLSPERWHGREKEKKQAGGLGG